MNTWFSICCFPLVNFQSPQMIYFWQFCPVYICFRERIWRYPHHHRSPHLSCQVWDLVLPHLQSNTLPRYCFMGACRRCKIPGPTTKDFFTHDTASSTTISTFALFPFAHKSHGWHKRSSWLLYMQWICVISEEQWAWGTHPFFSKQYGILFLVLEEDITSYLKVAHYPEKWPKERVVRGLYWHSQEVGTRETHGQTSLPTHLSLLEWSCYLLNVLWSVAVSF